MDAHTMARYVASAAFSAAICPSSAAGSPTATGCSARSATPCSAASLASRRSAPLTVLLHCHALIAVAAAVDRVDPGDSVGHDEPQAEPLAE